MTGPTWVIQMVSPSPDPSFNHICRLPFARCADSGSGDLGLSGGGQHSATDRSRAPPFPSAPRSEVLLRSQNSKSAPVNDAEMVPVIEVAHFFASHHFKSLFLQCSHRGAILVASSLPHPHPEGKKIAKMK